MKITTNLIKFIQRFLNNYFRFKLIIDGVAGQKTLIAIQKIPDISSDWSSNRMIIGCIQYICTLYNFEVGPIDGYCGPQTEYAYDLLMNRTKPWRDDEGIGASPNIWPIQTQDELIKFYGNVGENQTKVYLPYPLKIAWDTSKTINAFSCHKKVSESIERVLKNVLDYYGQNEITNLGLDLWGGCLNVRKMRGGTKYSTHSWGISIDWDPEHNQLKWDKNKARFSKDDYIMWWKFWEDEDWVSLGRIRNYDWMHIQAAKIHK